MDAMKDYVKPLEWGLSYAKFKELYAELGISVDYIQKGSVTLGGYTSLNAHTFDCGALIMRQAGCANKEILDNVHTIATKNGFSKIFATVVSSYTDRENVAKLFMDQPLWKCVQEGVTNRSGGSFKEWIFLYYNPDCEYKGH